METESGENIMRIPFYCKTVLLVAIIAVVALPFAGNCWAEDGKDHPLIKRYPGSEIGKYFVKDFDEVQMPAGKSERKNLPTR